MHLTLHVLKARAVPVIHQVLGILRRAVQVQCTANDVMPSRAKPDANLAPVLILFSGGVDSTLIAALAHLALPAK